MSYMSGMMMGMAFGQGIRRLFTKGGAPGRETPLFALARAIPGRRRYYAKALVGNEALAAAVESALARLDCVDEVKANPVSGSLLLVYHGDEARMDGIAERLASRVFEDPARCAKTAVPAVPAPKDGTAEGPAAFGRSIRGTFDAWNRQVKRLTCGWLDLPTLLSLVFTVRGIRKLLNDLRLPSGAQLLWWAFSLMRGWRVA